jgi:two-component system NtrC family response regulator
MRTSRAKSWSEKAIELFEAYPWSGERERESALRETELVSFGDTVEVEDLPLRVRSEMARASKKYSFLEALSEAKWKGEALDDAVEALERNILFQALEKNSWNVTATARDLKTTARIVSYKSKKYGLLVINNK